MKTMVLVVALVVCCIHPSYSQLNSDPKPRTETRYDNFDHADFGNFMGPVTSFKPKSLIPLAIIKPPLTNVTEVYSGDPMPCFLPEGNFVMKVVVPDSSMGYNMPIKKIITPRHSFKQLLTVPN